jgi:hypothetical protein
MVAALNDPAHFLKRDRQRIARALLQPRPSGKVHCGPFGGSGLARAFKTAQRGTLGGGQFAHWAYLDIGSGADAEMAPHGAATIINAGAAIWFALAALALRATATPQYSVD